MIECCEPATKIRTNLPWRTPPSFTKENIEDALTNLYVKESQGKMFGVAKGG